MKMPISMMAQPDDSTCGPTALTAVLHYLGLEIPLEQVIQETGTLKDGGTLAVFLGIFALKKGFSASLYNYNLMVFDPSWNGLSPSELLEKLQAQLSHKKGQKLQTAVKAYIEFLRQGGKIRFDDLDEKLLKDLIKSGHPVLTGLSSTYLYSCKREFTDDNGRSVYDDLKGHPAGHFVVLGGIENQKILVFDPYHDNPLGDHRSYLVPVRKLINAILLGIVTYDANLLVISRPDHAKNNRYR